MNKKNIIGIIVAILIIAVVVGIYFILTQKNDETNKQILDIHEHIFVEATCEKPKTCAICGIIEGEPLPHTTNIGLCTICGNLQNEDLILNIHNNVMFINKNTNNCDIQIQSANLYSPTDCFNKFSSVSTDIKNNNTYLENIVELCGEYTELKNIKENCNQLLLLEINITDSDVESLINFLTNFQSYLLITQNLYENMSELILLYV